MKISIIIKALNEEANIARTIESCLGALEQFEFDGEILLADSLSNDKTVEIASSYPITIIQLKSLADRGCGTAPQLGYQYCSGEFIYLIDGDMRLHQNFLPAAIQVLEQDDRLAGVGGIVRDMHLDNHEFMSRAARAKKDLQPGEVDRLDGGGLYRRSAIESVGYLSDRNLHAFEEFELAVRLRAKGWRLARINQLAVDHFGYKIGAYQLLWRRLTGGYALGAGEIARATLGRSTFPEVVRKIRTLWISGIVVAWLASLLLSFCFALDLTYGVGVSAIILILPLVFMSLRRRSLRLGLYAVAAWMVFTIGTIRGLVRRRLDPSAWIPSSVLKSRMKELA
ncbi:glycosyltransferase family 2 protein [Microvirga sp. 2TAF3]|uniref:glycosyltransferase family 2 protein n=1 Tax=Microvirga sp. 2TAF3 TaxID=3233014 RepID=UPI003F9D77B4